MRIDLCRKCGDELQIQKKCFSCNEPIKFQCIKCHYSPDEQFHFHYNTSQLIAPIRKGYNNTLNVLKI